MSNFWPMFMGACAGVIIGNLLIQFIKWFIKNL